MHDQNECVPNQLALYVPDTKRIGVLNPHKSGPSGTPDMTEKTHAGVTKRANDPTLSTGNERGMDRRNFLIVLSTRERQ